MYHYVISPYFTSFYIGVDFLNRYPWYRSVRRSKSCYMKAIRHQLIKRGAGLPRSLLDSAACLSCYQLSSTTACACYLFLLSCSLSNIVFIAPRSSPSTYPIHPIHLKLMMLHPSRTTFQLFKERICPQSSYSANALN